MPSKSADLVIDATRDWLERAVIGLNLCPFAKAVHVKRQIRYVVDLAQTTDALLETLEKELSFLVAADPAQIDTTLLIVPEMFGDFLDFFFFLAGAEALLKRMKLQGTIQIASFHPRYEFAGSEAEDIANYTNRSPYPTLHLLREASLDRAVAAFPDAADIYERNVSTLERLGHDGWEALWKK
ncbi:MAG TPA: DUF1415 domain-containing protein [Rhodocyclaceae bacterium]|nr:DUF1415 domain-containing protein [Rhodocyclaceae bacterium]